MDLKSGQEKGNSEPVMSVSIAQKEPRSILEVNARFVEVKNSNNQPSLTLLTLFEDYSLSAFSSQAGGGAIRHFTREEALAYITSVEFVDFPLLHLQEEFEDEFSQDSGSNILNMFYKRIRMQLIQLKEFVQVCAHFQE